MEIAVLALGCFWGPEKKYGQLDGVYRTEVGYCGGNSQNTNYREVCTGTTNHAEAVKLEFDPKVISYDEIIRKFFEFHDPTTLNRQGNDVGTQYRSCIFCLNQDQFKVVSSIKDKLNESRIWPKPIVTELALLEQFYEAENYHHNYYNNNKNQGYCKYVIQPKLEKFKKVFSDEIKLK